MWTLPLSRLGAAGRSGGREQDIKPTRLDLQAPGACFLLGLFRGSAAEGAGAVRMKLALLCLCFLHVALVSSRLFSGHGLQDPHRNPSPRRVQAPQSTGSVNYGRKRPLFARRGQYERQRIHVPKPRVVPDPPKDLPPPPKVAPKPTTLSCSQVTQSCSPQSGCCEPHAMCHCHFFNAICFCRRRA